MATNAFQLFGEIALTGAKKVMKQIEGLEDKLKGTGEAMKNVGETLTKSVTLPLTALGAGAIASAVNVEQAQGSIQASLGLTAEEAGALTDKARTLWKQGFGTDMADIANKVATVTRHVGELNDADLKDLIAGADVLESQFGADTQEQMVAVKTLMDNFGMSSSEAMDYLVTGFQKGLDYSGEFIDTIREYSTYFNEMGFSGAEFFDTLAQGAEGGAFQLDKVGDSMKEFTLRAKATDEATVEAFEGIGTNASEMISAFNAGGEEARVAFEKTVKGLQGVEDETKRNEIAVALFGTQYEDLGKEAFDAMLTASGAMGEVEGATRSASEALADNLGTRLQILGRETQDALVPLGTILVDLAEKWLPPLIEKIQGVAEWFAGLSDGGQKMTVIFGLIFASIGPVLVALGSVIGAVGSVIPVVVKVWGWLKKLNTVFKFVRLAMVALTGPVGLAIAIIGSLIIVAIKVYKNWDKISAWIKETWEKLKEKAKESFDKMKKAIVDKFNEIKTKTQTAWNNIKSAISTKASEIWSDVKAKFKKVKDAIVNPINTARDKIKTAIEKIKGFFTGLKEKMQIKFPKIKLPRFKIKNWSMNPVDWIEKRPSIGIDWYAKGGIFNGPSVIGVGEKGREAVLPLEGRYMRDLASTLAREMSVPAMAGVGNITVPVYLNGREIAKATAPILDRELEKQRKTRATFKGGTT